MTTLRLIRHALEEAWRVQKMNGDAVPCQGKKSDALQNMALLKTPLPDVLHFVWIGDLRALNREYINLWQSVNNGSRINLWHDEECSFSHCFHKLLAQYAKADAPHNLHQRLIELQNEAFHYIYPRLDKRHSFNALAVQFLRHLNIKAADLQPAPGVLTGLSDSVMLQSIPALFSGRFAHLKKYYYYEIILRGNFACASDIARLLVLYHYGGIYIDTDTLPAIDVCFPKTKALLKRYGAHNDEYATAAMAEAVVQKIRNAGEIKNALYTYIEQIPGTSSSRKKALYFSIAEEAGKLAPAWRLLQ